MLYLSAVYLKFYRINMVQHLLFKIKKGKKEAIQLTGYDINCK